MWWSKEAKIRKLNEQERLAMEYKPKKLNAQMVLDGEDPWDIDPVGNYLDNHSWIQLTGWKVTVYRFDTSEWDIINYCSDIMLGVTNEEINRIIKDKFNGVYAYIRSNSVYIFPTKEEAARAIEEFKPFYQSFYMPKAMMARLSNYTEGGYEPYFKEKAMKYGVVKLSKAKLTNIKKLREYSSVG